MKRIHRTARRSLLLPALALLSLAALPGFAQPLRVSDNRRHLVRADGRAFFWLGDTAWELFHRLTRDEADRYLKKRAEQGFTVIQAVVLAELDGLNAPTPEGLRPLKNNDPTQPDPEYFRKVDDVLALAQKHGLHVGLLPTWGDKVNGSPTTPATFNPQNARAYGKFLGERYKTRPNVIWVLGGDRLVDKPELLAIWRAMAEGITEGLGGADRGLFTFHPRGGGTSSTEFHQDAWLDLNMQQTGHCRYTPVHEKIYADYQLTPTKPVVNGEPIYEDHPVCFNVKDMGYSNAHDVRSSAYLSVLAGALGHTYGCHSVWQMWDGVRKPVNVPVKPWHESLDLPGASQMRHLRALVESRPVLDRVPNPALLAGPVSATNFVQAAQGKDYAFVYTALGLPVAVNLGTISGNTVAARWFNPRTGETQDAGTHENRGRKEFAPPRNNRDGLDWVLVLDDASKNYPAPGK